MSERVDVLAVMRRDASDAWNARYNDIPADAHEYADHCLQASEAAIAAIAELVEADREYDAAKAEQDDHAQFDENGMYVPHAVYARMQAATARRAAALARIGGAS